MPWPELLTDLATTVKKERKGNKRENNVLHDAIKQENTLLKLYQKFCMDYIPFFLC